MKDIYVYELEQCGCGVVKANSKREAERKVREAYEKHNTEFCEEINVYDLNELKYRWFDDAPDVVEIFEGYLDD